jgi:RNA recognition motif. (a.k.a. RRM, RBD, or RNP domain)
VERITVQYDLFYTAHVIYLLSFGVADREGFDDSGFGRELYLTSFVMINKIYFYCQICSIFISFMSLLFVFIQVKIAFVGNLPQNANEDFLHGLFSPIGKVNILYAR